MSRSYKEATAQIQANLQKHLDRHQSLKDHSSDENDASEDELASEDILSKVFMSYGNGETSDRTKDAIVQAMKAGYNSCLICISSLKKADPIWSCKNCFCSFHISCIQRWGKDCIYQQKNEQETYEDVRKPKGPLHWGCPNCRQNYQFEEIPKFYFCYCGKVRDPAFDPWNLPHSCGETCETDLQPNCGHKCLILCHPGPCPPCPQMVSWKCHCGSSPPAKRRCHDKSWSCGRKCGRTLNCGQHPCPLNCHSGPCQPCQKTSVQLCQCQRNQKKCDCSSPNWQCEEKCNRPLACGHHRCDIVCHKGECPPCPLSQLRHCPCGKNSYKLDCTEATPTCGDTCGKTLECGAHICAERCHRGKCGSCLQMSIKTCRCGNNKREVPCAKTFTCEQKCKKLRDCRRHPCNRKCCDGSCPPCEQTCSKPLQCKNHKCISRCHTGSCYPCNQSKEVLCNCGVSKLLVPCGRERAAKPPKCRQICKKPTNCHHEKRERHLCHFGPCPSCKQICSLKMKCDHLCPSPCHDQVKVTKAGVKGAVPWEGVSPTIEIKALDCPDCKYPVSVTCLGGHETSDWPCFSAKAGPCGRKCGRKLECGNHGCQRDCHRVKNAKGPEQCGSNCRRCELGCLRPRVEGCTHPCKKPCHNDPCDQCYQMVRIYCHCGLSQLYVKCGEWTDLSSEGLMKREDLACCQNQCPKLIDCGHRCSKSCHTGDCSDSSSCRKRTKIFCPCKRRKEEKQCGKLFTLLDGDKVKLACDSECEKIKAETLAGKLAEERNRKKEEERLQQEELERFEKQLEGGKRKRRSRRQLSQMEEASFMSKYKIPITLTAVLGIVLSLYFYAKL